LLDLAALDATPAADPGIEAEIALARGLASAARGASPQAAFERAVAAAERAGDPTQLAEVLSEILDCPCGTGVDLPIYELWAAQLERAATRTDSRRVARELRSFRRGQRREAGARVSKPAPAATRTYRAAIREFDRGIFRAALHRAEGRIPDAARLLDLPESTFRYRAAKAGVLRPKRTGEPAEGR
jgi:DNA-binding NtrC family response regulator